MSKDTKALALPVINDPSITKADPSEVAISSLLFYVLIVVKESSLTSSSIPLSSRPSTNTTEAFTLTAQALQTA
jgi:hypothetical protein